MEALNTKLQSEPVMSSWPYLFLTIALLGPRESFDESWERFKDTLRRCPHQEIGKWMQMQLFYNSLHQQERSMLDASSGGAFMRKEPDEAWNMVEEIATTSSQRGSERITTKSIASGGVMAQIVALNMELQKVKSQLDNQPRQNNYSGNNSKLVNSNSTNKDSNFVGQNRSSEYNNYNHHYKNNDNYQNQGGQNLNQDQKEGYVSKINQGNGDLYVPPHRQPWEVALDKMIRTIAQTITSSLEGITVTMQGVVEDFNQYKADNDARHTNTESLVLNLSIQMEQLANEISTRIPGGLPRNTNRNNRDCNAVFVRSGKKLIEIETTGDQEQETEGILEAPSSPKSKSVLCITSTENTKNENEELTWAPL